MNTNPPLGVFILARHGDRTSFYQNPTTYTASDTVLTPLGEQQNYQLGQLLRGIYAGNDTSRAIAGLSATEEVDAAVTVIADAGGEGSVIWDSAVALWQGFYPPSETISNMTLADGTTVTSPLGGYQYVKVATLLPTDDVDFEPFTSCANWTARNTAVYNSTEFKARAAAELPFFTSLKSSGILGNRTATLVNAYNVFDFLNVNSIHNATFAAEMNAIGNGTLEHARDLANYHEYQLFTDSTLGGLGNIAGRAILPRIISALKGFTAADNELFVYHAHLAYKPFLSLFNMTSPVGLADPEGMVDYASLAVYEVREAMNGASGYDVRFGFRNGSETTSDITYYPILGSDSVDLSLDTFVNTLEPYLIANNSVWCNTCGNNGTVEVCSEIFLAQDYETLAAKYKKISDGHFTSVGSGFIGAAVTLVVMVAGLAALSGLGWLSFGKKQKRQGERYPLNDQQSYKGSVGGSTTA